MTRQSTFARPPAVREGGRWRALTLPVVAVLAFVACDTSGAAMTADTPQAGQQAPAGARTNAAPSGDAQSVTNTQPVVVEFDLPDDYLRKGTDGRLVISGFRVGFFTAGEPEPVHVIDIARENVAVSGTTGTVIVPRQVLKGERSGLMLKMQTKASSGASAWSDPLPVTVNIAAARPERPERGEKRAAPRRGRQSLQLAEVEKHPALLQALQKVLPEGARVEDSLEGFRRVDDLALAVAVSREGNVPFTTLAAAIAGPPPMTLRNALRKLLPQENEGEIIRRARDQSRSLIAPGAGKP